MGCEVSNRAVAGDYKMRVLLVEDDARVARFVARALREQAYAVDVATTGEDALYQFAINTYDAVILDVTLVDINGFDVLQALKKHAVLKAVPVIMLTADAKRESVVRGLVGGADGYITKPFELKILVEGVRAILGLPAQPDDA